MKKGIIFGVLCSLLIVSCKGNNGAKGTSDVKVTSDEDKTFYTIGHSFGSRLENLKLKDSELGALNKGLMDAAKGVKPPFKTADYQTKVRELFMKRVQEQAKNVKVDGEKYIAKFLKEGGKKTASGLVYKMLKEGTGKVPTAKDTVRVHYHGKLINGTVFDSSVDRGKDVSFPLNRVIKGWTEGLQLVKEGGKIQLVIPSELAYGDHGAPPKIPGGATLIFDVELFEVKTAAAPAVKAVAKPTTKPADKK